MWEFCCGWSQQSNKENVRNSFHSACSTESIYGHIIFTALLCNILRPLVCYSLAIHRPPTRSTGLRAATSREKWFIGSWLSTTGEGLSKKPILIKDITTSTPHISREEGMGEEGTHCCTIKASKAHAWLCVSPRAHAIHCTCHKERIKKGQQGREVARREKGEFSGTSDWTTYRYPQIWLLVSWEEGRVQNHQPQDDGCHPAGHGWPNKHQRWCPADKEMAQLQLRLGRIRKKKIRIVSHEKNQINCWENTG